mmetsp:Transcript_2421/g.9420  ORF Transcript_2421/g.9420 Transcript_2421/m.9420 type:complete len:287 (-) Transcript_2421:1106-1966(-)
MYSMSCLENFRKRAMALWSKHPALIKKCSCVLSAFAILPPRNTPTLSRLACGCVELRCFPDTTPRAAPVCRCKGKQLNVACASPTRRFSNAVAASATSWPTPFAGSDVDGVDAAWSFPSSPSPSVFLSEPLAWSVPNAGFFCRSPVNTANSPRCDVESSRAFSISSSRKASALALDATPEPPPVSPPPPDNPDPPAQPSNALARAAALIASAVCVAVSFDRPPLKKLGAAAAGKRSGSLGPPASAGAKVRPASAFAFSRARFSSAAWNAGGSSPPIAPPDTRAYSR